MAELEVALTDRDHNFPDKLPVKVEINPDGIFINPQGYGDLASADGFGCPLFLELYQGNLRVIIYKDINQEEPEIVNLEQAKESARKEN